MSATVVPAGAGPQFFMLGDYITLKVHGRDTGGVFSQIETTCGPQVGPPLHIHHREDETFYVLEGEFEFVCAGMRSVGGPGTVVQLPRGIPHRFKNIGETQGRILVTMTPAGFEGFFEDGHALSPEDQMKPEILFPLAARYGLEFLPPA